MGSAARHDRYVHVAIPRPIDQPFTYAVPDAEGLAARLQVGSRVRVPFGRSRAIGFVAGWTTAPRGITIKPIAELLDETEPLLDATLVRLTQWVAAYYGCSWAEAAESVVPPQMRRQPFRAEQRAWDAAPAQAAASAHPAPSWAAGQPWYDRLCQAIAQPSTGIWTLQGGAAHRIALYRHLAAQAIAAGRTVIWLVPEVVACEAVEQALEEIGRWTVVLHGGLRAGARRERWLAAASGGARLVIGTRSAVFTRLPDVGLLIIDDESDASYKPEQAPRYHAREVAVERGRIADVPVVLGSVVPSLEARAMARRGHGEAEVVRVEMPRPRVTVVDMREERKERRRIATLGVSRRLEHRLEETLRGGGRALLFLNRRGFATTIRCPDCGYVVRCEPCGTAFVYHFDAKRLLCHYCGAARPLEDLCPACGKAYLRFRGVGTERLESEVHRLFPNVRTARIDSDAVRRLSPDEEATPHLAGCRPEAVEGIAQALAQRQLDVVVGTQLVHRTMDRWPALELVGVITADLSLSQPDFRAAERTLQWLTRLAGVAAGPEAAGELIVQTFAPEHPVMQAIATGDETAFWDEEWRLREAVQLPPVCHLIQIDCWGGSGEAVAAAAKRLASRLRRAMKGLGAVAGPLTAPAQRRGSGAVHRLLVRVPGAVEPAVARVRAASSRGQLGRGVRVRLDVDP